MCRAAVAACRGRTRQVVAIVAVLVGVSACSGGPPRVAASTSPARLPSAAVTPAPATSPQPPVPAYLLNPAVTPDTAAATICVAGWSDMVRPPSSYTDALKRRQLPAGADPAGFEEDHLMPLSLGGAPRDERNLWPQPWLDARRKDVDESRAHRDVCAGRVGLAAAQQAMYAKWRPW